MADKAGAGRLDEIEVWWAARDSNRNSCCGGHEYGETVTDPFPNSGWLDGRGAENGDKCAWIASGQGASQNIGLGGNNYAVQSLWSNAFNSGAGGCVVTYP